MWFVLLGIALVILTAGGLYFRRRFVAALAVFGARRRSQRIVGWIVLWLLYGVPVLVFVFVIASIALGRESVTPSVTGAAEWLVVYPFWFAVLVVLQTVPFLLLVDLSLAVARRRISLERATRCRAIACLVVVAVFSVYTPARILVERDDLNVNHYRVGTGSSGQTLRIGFFADLQQDNHTDNARASEVMSLINEHNPDVILVGGDWINSGPDYIEAAARSGSNLRSELGTFSVRGDHEHFAYRDMDRSVREVSEALARHGLDMVHNEVRIITRGDKRVAVIYLSYNYIYRTPTAEIRTLIEAAQDADYSILLTHQFDDALARLVENKVDLALIAHTHGGQVNPVVGFVHVPIARVETPYIAGRYQLGETTLIVTSGIGFSIAPFRYAAPASIEIIDLHL